MNRYYLLTVFFLFSFFTFSYAQLSGTYTIGSGGNYSDLSSAVSDLTSQGVNGAVTFNILSGTYNEQIEITAISGISASNTVTFQSQTGNAADVTITHAATGAGDNYVFKLDGASYVTVQDLTLSATGTSYGTVIQLSTVSHITIRDNTINGYESASSSSNHALINAYNTDADNITIEGCTLNDGAYGIYMSGPNNSNRGTSNVIQNNAMNGQVSYALHLTYQTSPRILSNDVTDAQNYGFYLQSCNEELEVIGNHILAPNYPLYINGSTGGNGQVVERGLVANNFIINDGNGSYSLYLYNNTNLDVFNNSLVHVSGNINTSCLYLYAGSGLNLQNNNAMHNGQGYAFNIYSTSALSGSDYNNLFSNGNYLGKWGNDDQYDLAAYQSVSGMESNSRSVYPNFTSLTDLHTASPWLDGAGAVLSRVTTDIDGEARDGSAPDIGADEFTPAAGTTTPLSGVYTIGGSSPDYATVADAVTDLLLKGVSDSVSMEIRDGSYNVSQVLYTVPGSGPDKPVVFRSESDDREAVDLYHVASGASDNYVMYLKGADHIRFVDLGFSSNTAVNATYSRALYLDGGVEDFHLVDCKLTGSNTTNSNAALYHAYRTVGTNRYIAGNEFNSGSYGIYHTGYSANQPNRGVVVMDNQFNNQRSYSGYFTYDFDLKLMNNTISGAQSYGFYLQSCNEELEVIGNHILAPNYPLYINGSTGGNGQVVERGLVANNFIINDGNGSYSLYLYNNTNLDVFNNSLVHVSGNINTSCLYLYAGSGLNLQNNNAMHNGQGYAFNIYSTSALSGSDYNNLFSNGNYLGKWGNDDQYDLAAYQSVSGMESNSRSVYPNFTSLTDLHTASPWLDGAGAVLSRVTTDIDGEARDGSAPDIGADEFTPAAGTTTPLSGVYTIGGSSPDYATVADAVTDLLLKGVSDSVSMEIRDGSYNVSQVLYTVPGSGPDKPVVFRSESDDREAVDLYHVASGASDNYVMYLKGADHIRFVDLGFSSNTAVNATYSRALYLDGGVEDFHLVDCKLTGSNTTNSNAALYHAYRTVGTNRYIAGNEFNSGSYGIYHTGYSANQPNRGVVVMDNQFNNQRSYSGYFTYDFDLKLMNNTISGAQSYGFYLQNCDGELEVIGNRITALTYPIYIYNSTGGTGQVVERGLVANNFIHTSSGMYSLYSYNNTNIDFYHNSINNLSTNASSSSFYVYAGSGLNVVNNIFLNKGQGYAYNVQSPNSIARSDYNDMYVYGNNVGAWGSTQAATLEDFRQISLTDSNSVSVNPGFQSDTEMYAVSAVLDSAATPLARVLHDIDGEVRDAMYPDIGADEFDSTAVVGIDEDRLAQNIIPKAFRIYNNYPNPFNPATTIKYDLPKAEHVRLEVYNILGQMVAKLVDQQQSAGTYVYRFDGRSLSSGTYFFRIQAGEHNVVRKMILSK